MKMAARISAALFAAALLAAGAFAQDGGNTAGENAVADEKPAPYDADLTRLAEIIGSIHYIGGLCGSPPAQWREMMGQLLQAETRDEPRRRERLTAAFNRGYRAFAAIHTTCTAAARQAETRYRAEGATLAGEITARYGN